jgi:hypothetical protein
MAGRVARATPAELSPGSWPFDPSPDPHAEVARLFVNRLRKAMGDQSVRAVAKDAGLNHAGLNKLLAGGSWPDLLTIARLERTLGADLWPGRPRG